MVKVATLALALLNDFVSLKPLLVFLLSRMLMFTYTLNGTSHGTQLNAKYMMQVCTT